MFILNISAKYVRPYTPMLHSHRCSHFPFISVWNRAIQSLQVVNWPTSNRLNSDTCNCCWVNADFHWLPQHLTQTTIFPEMNNMWDTGCELWSPMSQTLYIRPCTLIPFLQLLCWKKMSHFLNWKKTVLPVNILWYRQSYVAFKMYFAKQISSRWTSFLTDSIVDQHRQSMSLQKTEIMVWQCENLMSLDKPVFHVVSFLHIVCVRCKNLILLYDHKACFFHFLCCLWRLVYNDREQWTHTHYWPGKTVVFMLL